MKNFGIRGKTGQFEREIRAERPAPPADFMLGLTNEVLRSRRPARPRAYSRAAFALAVATFVIGSFASFGGISYAASGATSAVDVVKRAVVHHSVSVHKRSAALAQYGPASQPAGQQEAAGQQGVAQVAGTSTLPFTGISLAFTAAIGIALLLTGIALRRVERQRQ